jgi:uncharacterized membrane protein/mono/diheme cytochrome c family protein
MVPLTEISSLLAATGPDLPRAAGRLHPLVVHFPIALALVAVAAEWWRGVRRIEGMSPLTMPLLWIAAVSAIAATSTGWLNAAHEHDGSTDPTLDRHRWIGTATTVALLGMAWWGRSLCAALVHPTAEAFARLGAFRWMAAVLAVAVGVTGHLGGELVYGKGYVAKALFPPAAKPTEPPTEAPAAEPAALTPSELHFIERVQPLLEAHCIECHGSRRQRGGLRMDSREALFEGEEYEWAVIPGKSAESEVLKRVVLGRDDPDAMPPEGPGLSQEEIEALRKWIDEGAVWPEAGAPAGGAASGVAASAAESATRTGGGGSTDAVPADVRAKADAAARTLAARGVLVQPLALESAYLDVNASRAAPPLGAADAPLLADLAPLVVNLNLSQTALGDDGLAAIGPMPLLERLRLDGTAIGDGGLAALGTLPKLESVNLVGTAVTPASVAWLRAQPALRRVYVWRTGLDTPEAIAALREGGSIDPIGGDLPLAQPTTPPMPEDAPAGDAAAQ